MGDITISGDAIRYIQAVEDHVNRWTLQALQKQDAIPQRRVRTQLHVIDCVEEPDRLVFVVEKGHLGMALGKDAQNLQRLKELFKKDVKFIEFDPEKPAFVQNVFKPFKVTKVDVEQKRGGGPLVATVTLDEAQKGKAIGKGGKNVNLARLLAKRHHDIDEVKVL